MVMKPGAKRGNYPVKGVQPLGWDHVLQRDVREVLKEDTRRLLDEYFKERQECDIGVEDNTQLCEG
jgi:hypothetical protein